MAGGSALDLVVVSGLPAAGKSTTARRLASDLAVPLLWRGQMRRAVLEPIRQAFPAVADGIPAATDRLVSAAVETGVAGGPVVLDANLHNERQRRSLRELAEGRSLDCFEVFLSGDDRVLRSRLEERADPPVTPELASYLDEVFAGLDGPALSGLAPAVEIDTSSFEGYDAAYAEVLAAVRARTPDIRPPGPGAVVVISGLPAAGKSTLARRLGHDLGASVVWRDGLRRRVLADLGNADADIGPCIPAASDALVRTVLGPLLAAGRTVVVDGNFNNAVQAEALVEFLGTVGPLATFEVCLWGEVDALRKRFVERADPPLTPDLRPYFEMVVSRERTPVLGGPTPCVHLDTTDLATLDRAYPELLRRIQQHLEASRPVA